MNKFYIVVIFVFNLLCSIAIATEISKQDFAYAIPIKTLQKDTVFYQFNLPLSVYENVVRDDLGDIAIFNQEGQIVPSQIRLAKHNKTIERMELAFFPIFSDGTPVEQVKMQLLKNNTQSSLKVTSKMPIEKQKKLTSYIFDTTAIKDQYVIDLTLDWKTTHKDWIVKTELKTSDDLLHWQSVPASITSLTEIDYASNNIVNKTIKVPFIAAKYLMLTWYERDLPFEITSAKVEWQKNYLPAMQWKYLTALKEKTSHESLYYETGGVMPVAEINLEFQQQHAPLQALIYSRAQADQPWQEQKYGLFYQFKMHDNVISNPPIELRPQVDRYWRVKPVNEQVLQPEQFRLKIGWHPARLTFMAQGTGPYLLAFGSGNIINQPTVLTKMMDELKEQGKNVRAGKVILGDMIELTGAKALKSKVDIAEVTRKVILWLVLLCGLVLVIWMARSLYLARS